MTSSGKQVIYVVDAFTDRPFAGNPAGVCLLPAAAEPAWMQRVAAEMNHAETAFVWPVTQGFQLRWFTPTVEVPLCGHATLAAAHQVWQAGLVPVGQAIAFTTCSGVLTARQAAGGGIELDFPAEPAAATAATPALRAAVNLPVRFAGRNRMDWLVAVDDAAALAVWVPDPGALAAVDTPRGIIVTAVGSAPGRPASDFVSRFFAPRAGIAEDPVTGSAHCALGPYWAAQLGRNALTGYQASRRGGLVEVRVEGARVMLIGRAVTVLRCELQVQ